MNEEIAISLRDVTKIYRLYDKPIDRLRESMSLTHKSYHKDFFALDKISFDVKKGETVGIIGTNGSGKSTILKIITGVLTPSSGEIEVDGNISALLELGAGFNGDYTGMENIYMNGTMMGFSRHEMDSKLDDILSFADIGDFVHQPVKTYSSGMFVRLAFALAINVDPDILIVDEALSVGDVFFQAKCYRRMEQMMNDGTTILMVSHDMGSIIKYCDKVILLNKGSYIAQGQAGHMVDLYKKILANRMDDLYEELEREGQDSERLDCENYESQGFEKQGTESLGDTSGSDIQRPTIEKDAIGNLVSDGNDNASNIGGDINTDGSTTMGMPRKDTSMISKMSINPNKEEYGDGRARIYDLGLIDANGNVTNLLLKGELFTIRQKIRFEASIETPIFTYTFRDKKGTDLTGTNTMFEGCDIRRVSAGDEYEVNFTQKMTLQGGEYLLSMSCTGYEDGQHVVYHRLYNIASVTVISNKNTVGIYDMESVVEAKLVSRA